MVAEEEDVMEVEVEGTAGKNEQVEAPKEYTEITMAAAWVPPANISMMPQAGTATATATAVSTAATTAAMVTDLPTYSRRQAIKEEIKMKRLREDLQSKSAQKEESRKKMRLDEEEVDKKRAKLKVALDAFEVASFRSEQSTLEYLGDHENYRKARESMILEASITNHSRSISNLNLS